MKQKAVSNRDQLIAPKNASVRMEGDSTVKKWAGVS
jgi:hypothetical protein